MGERELEKGKPKLRLLNPRVTPPEPFFRYRFPSDGYESVATTHDAWLIDAGMHAAANGLAGPSAEEMEDQLCQTLPPGWCEFDDENRPRPSTALDWGNVEAGLKTFGRWIVGGCKFVSQEEADRRALVCTRCYLNVSLGGCSGCQRMIAEVVGNKTTKYDFALRACGVCKCVLKAKVHFPQSILDKENQTLQEMYPSFCWNRKDGENYRP